MTYQVSRNELRRLLPEGWLAEPRQLLISALADWALIGVCWWAMSLSTVWLLDASLIFVIAGRFHALGVILHDACHRPGHRKSPTFWLVEALAGWTIGSTIEAMRYHHLRHHRASCTRHDPYRHSFLAQGVIARWLMTLRGALLPFWWSLRAFFAPVALVWPRSRNFYGRAFLQDRSGEDLRRHPEILACAKADLAQAAAHTISACIITAYALPFFEYYLLPWVIGGVLNARRVIIEHETDEVFDLSPTTVWNTTRTHGETCFAQFFLYPHNIGLHQAHHLYPTVGYVHLPKVHRHLKATVS